MEIPHFYRESKKDPSPGPSPLRRGDGESFVVGEVSEALGVAKFMQSLDVFSSALGLRTCKSYSFFVLVLVSDWVVFFRLRGTRTRRSTIASQGFTEN